MSLLAAHPGYAPPGTQSFVFKSFVDFTVGPVHFHINRLTSMLAFGVVCIALFFLVAFRKPQLVPGRLQAAAESIYDVVRNGIARQVIGPDDGLRFAPYLATLFVFILVMNFYEILPLAQVPVTSRIAFPGVLAIASWIIFNYVGIRKQGAGHYLKGVLFPPGVPKAMYILLTPIEFFSTFVFRPFTLAVRLFMNMFAGHLLLLVFITGCLYLKNVGGVSYAFSAVSFVMAVLLTFFELIVIVIQAYVFTVLTAVYVSGALAEEH